MDQIFQEVSIPSSHVHQGLFSLDSFFNRMLAKIFGAFIDINLFFDEGMSLYAWRYFMNMLKEFQFADIYNYRNVYDLAYTWINEINVENDDFSYLKNKCFESFVSKLIFLKSVFNGNYVSVSSINIKRSSKSYDNINDLLMCTSASEYIFFLISKSSSLFSKDIKIKRNIGMFLKHCLAIEKHEYQKCYNEMKFLEGNVEQILNYDTLFSMQKVQNILTEVKANRALKFHSTTTDMVLSPWYMAIALIMYLKEQSLWNDMNISSEILSFVTEKDFPALILPQKRLNECIFRLNILILYLPNIQTYEKEISSIQRDKTLTKLLYEIPQVIFWGKCIDKQKLIDVTVEQNIKKVIDLFKKEVLHGNEVQMEELYEIFKNPNKKMQMFNDQILKSLNSILQSLILNTKHQIYKEFFDSSQTIHYIIPIFMALFILHELQNVGITNEKNQILLINVVYAILPFFISIVYETQENLLQKKNKVISM